MDWSWTSIVLVEELRESPLQTDVIQQFVHIAPLTLFSVFSSRIVDVIRTFYSSRSQAVDGLDQKKRDGKELHCWKVYFESIETELFIVERESLYSGKIKIRDRKIRDDKRSYRYQKVEFTVF
ncbi:hypothetical protein GCK72_013111 [Caenorhabditis remanei]|uniref:Uncharacterized protein n=1 Tax=Caenorhabditis remanei TaxID=31234 RepID=A0A6A5GMW1_CAERE|nr:hypothetical protein GCK72_013111 [Caenorhabditis remanei]KAF1756657.1 hypothetical protein GCK72_013111 [Caenorhabditis remanei]